MCTYLTEQIDITGSGKGANGYFPLTRAMVYVDHPQHAPYELELTEEGALALIEALRSALASAPPGLASEHQNQPA
jgi:hypothetical protein